MSPEQIHSMLGSVHRISLFHLLLRHNRFPRLNVPLRRYSNRLLFCPSYPFRHLRQNNTRSRSNDRPPLHNKPVKGHRSDLVRCLHIHDIPRLPCKKMYRYTMIEKSDNNVLLNHIYLWHSTCFPPGHTHVPHGRRYRRHVCRNRYRYMSFPARIFLFQNYTGNIDLFDNPNPWHKGCYRHRRIHHRHRRRDRIDNRLKKHRYTH